MRLNIILYAETDPYQGATVFANWPYKPIVIVTKAQLYDRYFISYMVRRTFSSVISIPF